MNDIWLRQLLNTPSQLVATMQYGSLNMVGARRLWVVRHGQILIAIPHMNIRTLSWLPDTHIIRLNILRYSSVNLRTRMTRNSDLPFSGVSSHVEPNAKGSKIVRRRTGRLGLLAKSACVVIAWCASLSSAFVLIPSVWLCTDQHRLGPRLPAQLPTSQCSRVPELRMAGQGFGTPTPPSSSKSSERTISSSDQGLWENEYKVLFVELFIHIF